jgi:hypothetical protein
LASDSFILLTPSSPVMPCGIVLFICPWYACLLPSDSSSHLGTLRQPPRLQNTQELTPLFTCWVTLAYTSVRRKVSAVCQDDYWNHWAKDMHIKDRWKVRCHMASLGWKGLRYS